MKKDIPSLLDEIIKSSHWTQERLAAELDVSFATVNSWINGHSVPRQSMQKRIEDLYLARRPQQSQDEIYITIINCPEDLKIEDYVILEKDPENNYDDESICVTPLEQPYLDTDLRICMYVANSVNTVIRGTQSAGRIYDKITSQTKAQIKFIHRSTAIAKLV